MRAQMSGQVNVEVDASPQQDLQKVLDEIREQNEMVAAKNRRDLEKWYQAKVGRGSQGQRSVEAVNVALTFVPVSRRSSHGRW